MQCAADLDILNLYVLHGSYQMSLFQGSKYNAEQVILVLKMQNLKVSTTGVLNSVSGGSQPYRVYLQL